jgi:hypothetical protein
VRAPDSQARLQPRPAYRRWSSTSFRAHRHGEALPSTCSTMRDQEGRKLDTAKFTVEKLKRRVF